MSFRGLAQGYDFSTLPKVVTHAQLGRIGDCAWYSPWDCVIPEQEKAAQELADAHQWLLDFANAIATLRDDAVAGGAPQSIIDGFNDSLEKQKALVQQHTDIQNQFNAKVSGVAGLKGVALASSFNRPTLGRLGVWQVALLEIAPLLGILARQLYWVWVTYILGQGVSAFKTNADAAQTEALARGDCYKLYREALAANKPTPNCVGTPKPDQDWTTIALIGGSVVLAVLLLQRRR